MNKKGINVVLFLFELIFVIAAIGLAILAVNRAANEEEIVKQNMATDLVMMINTLVGLPGDALVGYPYDTKEYSFILTSKQLTIYTKSDKNPLHRELLLPADYTALGALENSPTLCLEKKKKDIILATCPSSDTSSGDVS